MNKIGAFVLAFVLGGLVFGFIALIGFAVWGVGKTVDEVSAISRYDRPDVDFSVTTCREVITTDNVADLGWDLDNGSVNEESGLCTWGDDDAGNRVTVINSGGYGDDDERMSAQLRVELNKCSEARFGPGIEYQPEWLGQPEDEVFACVQSNVGSEYGSVVNAHVYDNETGTITDVQIQSGYEQTIGDDWHAGLADMVANAREQS